MVNDYSIMPHPSTDRDRQHRGACDGSATSGKLPDELGSRHLEGKIGLMSGPHVLKEARGGKAHQAPLSRIFRIAQMNQFEDDPISSREGPEDRHCRCRCHPHPQTMVNEPVLSRVPDGTGLGLPLVSAMAGLSLRLNSELEAGTTILVVTLGRLSRVVTASVPANAASSWTVSAGA
jgi:hypothetical protein